MKLDRNRSFGHTYGHAYAVFEQDGNLFDGAGDLAEAPAVSVVKKPKQGAIVEESAERLFLLELLNNGPVRKEAIHKESEIRGLSWELVMKEVSQMDIYSFEQGKGPAKKEMWKLGND